MIINSNLQTPEKQTIEYIRNIAGYFTEAQEEQKLDDSLVFSFTQSEKSKAKKQKKKPKYVSPYSQKDISMKKITKSKKKSPERLNAFASLNIQQPKPKQSTPQSYKKSSVSHRYMQTPSLIERIAQREIDKLKQEACQLYKIQLKQKKYKDCQLCKIQLKQKKKKVCQLCKIKKNQKQELTDSQRKAKWADFLLRQRRWEENRQSKIMEAKYQAISQQKKLHSHNFVPKKLPPSNLELHIRKIKRQKLKLEQRLRQLQPNYLTWRKQNSPSRKKINQIKTQRPEVSNQKRICLSNQKEVSFLLQR